MIELRCERHLHLRLDPATGTVEVKCGQCSKRAGKPVFHRWRLVVGVAEDPADQHDSPHADAQNGHAA